MRFKQLIHPELLIGKRGNAKVRAMHAELLSQVDLEDGGIRVGEMLQAMGDVNLSDAVALMKKWVQSPTREIYHSGGDFLKEISKVNRDIPIELLPDHFIAYISFGKDIIHDEEDAIQGAYVYVGPAKETSFAHHGYVSNPDAKVLWIAYMTDGGEMNTDAKAGALRLELKPGMKMKELMAEVGCFDMFFGEAIDTQELSLNAREVVFRTVINLVLYIHQPDPELERLAPSTSLGPRKYEQRLQQADKGTAIFNSCSLPVVFVNWKWHKPIASHIVTGHFKWQPCGLMKQQRKLIYVEAYPRGLNAPEPPQPEA